MSRRRPLALHHRLAAVVALVLLVTLSASGAATYLAFSAYLRERLDQSLRDAPIVGDGDLQPAASLPQTSPAPGGPRVTPFVRLTNADGRVLRLQPGHDSTGHALTPVLPQPLPQVAVSTGGAGPAVFLDSRSVESAGVPLRVKISRDGEGNVLVLALPRADNDALLSGLAQVEAYVAATALALASGAAWLIVRRRLRSLRTLARHVDTLDPTDVGVRVGIDPATLEVRDLGAATNRLLQRVDDALAREQATQEGLRRFIADASHELRTPVAAVSAYSQLFELGAKDRPDDLARTMTGIRRETARMHGLIEELLTLAAADASPFRETEPVDLVAVLTQAVDAAAAVDPERPVELLAGPGTAEVLADPDGLRRVVDNLLSNVRTHTPSGTRTTIRGRRSGQRVILTVADDGPGLTPGERARMTERFWRKDTSRSRSAGGSGLGLSIVAALVRGWQGTIAAGETPGGGLTVILELRAAATRAPRDERQG